MYKATRVEQCLTLDQMISNFYRIFGRYPCSVDSKLVAFGAPRWKFTTGAVPCQYRSRISGTGAVLARPLMTTRLRVSTQYSDCT